MTTIKPKTTTTTTTTLQNMWRFSLMARHITPSKRAWQKRLPRLQVQAVGMTSMREHDARCKTQDVRRRTQASPSTLLLTTRRHCQSHPCPATRSCRLAATGPPAESSAACSRAPGPPAARSFSANHPPNCCCANRGRFKIGVASRHSSLPGTTSSRLPGPPAESSACLVPGATSSRLPGPPAQSSACSRFPGPPAESPSCPIVSQRFGPAAESSGRSCLPLCPPAAWLKAAMA